jgi:hypothetical protein
MVPVANVQVHVPIIGLYPCQYLVIVTDIDEDLGIIFDSLKQD